MKTALVLVDIQNDFVPGGSLAVPGGDTIIPIIERLVKMPFDVIVATKDWHPANHASFASNHGRQPGEVITLDGIEQILWPVHCVQGTSGADFVRGWDSNKVHQVFHKGTDPKVDSYSTFYDNAKRRSTGLADYLRELGITRIFVAGLATDYCVKFSVLDARDLGFDTYVVVDACRGIDLHEGDVVATLKLIEDLGGHLCSSHEVAGLLS